jgi:hypothetical protein
MNPPSPERIPVGPHFFTIVEPDLLILEFADPIAPDDVRETLDLLLQTAKERGPCKVLMDISLLKGIPRDVRAELRARREPAKHAALAFVGAPFGMRIVIDMVIAAVRLLRPERPRYPHSFFDRKEDALAWLHAQPNAPQARVA